MVFLGRTRLVWVIGGLWASVVALLALHYPQIRGPLLQRAYAAVALASLAWGVGAMILWTWRRRAPSGANGALLACYCVEGVVVAGPYAYDLFAGYQAAQASYSVLYLGLTLAQVIAWVYTKLARVALAPHGIAAPILDRPRPGGARGQRIQEAPGACPPAVASASAPLL